MPSNMQTSNLVHNLAECIRNACNSKKQKSDGKSEYLQLIKHLRIDRETTPFHNRADNEIHLLIAKQVVASLQAFFAEIDKRKNSRRNSGRKYLLSAIYFLGRRICKYAESNGTYIGSDHNDTSKAQLKIGAFLLAESCKIESPPVFIKSHSKKSTYQTSPRTTHCGYSVEPNRDCLGTIQGQSNEDQKIDCEDPTWDPGDEDNRWSAMRYVRRKSDKRYESLISKRKDQLPPPDKVVSAVNFVQETEWIINQPILQILAKIPEQDRHRLLGGKFPDANAEHYDIEKRRFDSLIEFAESKVDKTFKTSYYMDFRGRVYARVDSTEISPQGRDWERALLRFSIKEKLGPHGWKWLCNHLYAHSTESSHRKKFAARQDWVEQKRREIEKLVEDPTSEEGQRIWDELAKPGERLQFLAVCQEACDAWRHKDQHHTFETFESNLPVAIDGVCNGYQHMSALLRDQQTAELTNVLTTENEPQDFYGTLAEQIRERNGSSDEPIDEEKIYDYAIDSLSDRLKKFRRLMKKLAEKIGRLNSAIYFKSEDGWLIRVYCEKSTRQTVNFSEFNGIKVKAYVLKPCKSGRETDIAESRSNIDKDLRKSVKDILVPYGYGKEKRKFLELQKETRSTKRRNANDSEIGEQTIGNRIRLVVHDLSVLREKSDKSRINTSMLANYIHCLDATLLHRVLNAAKKDGLNGIQVIHDSFGTQAGRMEELHRIILDEFTSLYRESPLRNLLKFYRNRIDWLRAWHYSRKHDLKSTETIVKDLISVLDELEACIGSNVEWNQAESGQTSPYLFS